MGTIERDRNDNLVQSLLAEAGAGAGTEAACSSLHRDWSRKVVSMNRCLFSDI